VIAAGAGQLLMKAGALESGLLISKSWYSMLGWKALFSNWMILLGLIMWVLSTLIYLVVLTRTELSFAYCLGSLNYVLVPVLGQWIFNEWLSPLRIVGMIVIFMGVTLVVLARMADSALAR
jgi:drug/metabolite transporter (DMT)-like permease